MANSQALSRRALLFGRSRVEATALRPPWAVAGPAFAAACSRCDDCIQACPEAVLVRGSDGLPRFDALAGECTFCAACVDACGTGALDASLSPPWQLRAQVGEACLPGHGVVCSSCREICPESAIRIPPGARGAAHIDPAACTGCGACVAICPGDAITLSHSPLELAA